MAKTLVVLNGPNIAVGESLSDGLDCSSGPIVKVTMPPEWDNANITFQTSTDGMFYNDMFDTDGHEISFKVYPVPQSAARSFAVAVDVMATSMVLEGDSP